MIEISVSEYLIGQHILGSHVYMEKPTDPEDEYILIEKTGSDEENRIKQATIAIQSISRKSLYRAAQINQAVKEAMEGIIYSEYGDYMSKARLETDYNFTNTATKEYRYQAVYSLYFIKE